MRIAIVIPFYNEESFLKDCIHSFLQQTRVPDQIVLVDDSSTDDSSKIAQALADEHEFILYLKHKSEAERVPGSKVIRAFNYGLQLCKAADFIGKFDADLILPNNYFESLIEAFNVNPKLGMCSGLLFVQNDKEWTYENITDQNHVRGPVKFYSKACFEAIGGLYEELGWDSIDTLLANCQGFETSTLKNMQVKHLRPTSKAYHSKSEYHFKRGMSYYKMGYDFTLSFLSILKQFFKTKDIRSVTQQLRGFLKAKKSRAIVPFVSPSQGRCIRKIRYQKIREKIF